MTTNFLIDPEFDLYRAHIQKQLREGKTWADLRVQLEQASDALDAWFVSQEMFSSWPSLGPTPQERRAKWIALLDAKQDAESRMTLAKRPLVVVGREETEPNIKVNRPGFFRHPASSLRNAFQTLSATADC